MFVINSNQGLLNHLLKDYSIDKDGNKVKKEAAKGIVNTIVSVMTNKSLERFKYLLVRWIIYCNIAFYMLKNKYFRELVAYINKGLS